ncbi:MAG: GIY-YIG nuclease family protein [Arcticibacter sp.]
MFWTYAIFSEKSNKIYVGHTNDLQRRINEHNGLTEFKYWTTSYRPWKLFYSIFFETRSQAMAEEKWLKSGVGRRLESDLSNSIGIPKGIVLTKARNRFFERYKSDTKKSDYGSFPKKFKCNYHRSLPFNVFNIWGHFNALLL